MIAKIGQALTFYFWFYKGKVGVIPASVPTFIIGRKGSGSPIATGTCTAFPNLTGLFFCDLANTGTATADGYAAVAHTSDTGVDMQDAPSLWIVGTPAPAAQAGDVMGKSPATLDWAADVASKPTIGTSVYAGGPVASVTGTVNANILTVNGLPVDPQTVVPFVGTPMLADDVRLPAAGQTIATSGQLPTIDAQGRVTTSNPAIVIATGGGEVVIQ